MKRLVQDQYLAEFIVSRTGQYGPIAVLVASHLTVALTQPMSNTAAALVMLPIAVKRPSLWALNPRAFAVAVRSSFLFFPYAARACLRIGFTPGRYRFFDFVKVGSILTIVVFAIVIWLVPVFWPLQP